MNTYGRMAMRHWQTHLPDQFHQVSDPEIFFDEMGKRAASQISELESKIAGADEESEPYLQKVGRLTNARMRAEEIVLREEVLMDPESGQDAWPLETGESSNSEDWIPLEVDLAHPYWEETLRMEADDQESEQLYQRMLSEQSTPKGTPRP